MHKPRGRKRQAAEDLSATKLSVSGLPLRLAAEQQEQHGTRVLHVRLGVETHLARAILPTGQDGPRNPNSRPSHSVHFKDGEIHTVKLLYMGRARPSRQEAPVA